ncbi:MAG: kinase, partial [Prochlorotrichaceae cyanobacterium]
QQLQDLFQASGGLFLGQDPRHQRQWLQGDPEQRQALTVLLELWCDDRSFRFISEGDQRFPLAQIQLSPRLPESQRSSDPKIFCLKATGDPLHPHRFQVQLPYWALDGVDLQRWVWGFKEQVRVVSPAPWVAKFRQDAEAIGLLYGECKET